MLIYAEAIAAPRSQSGAYRPTGGDAVRPKLHPYPGAGADKDGHHTGHCQEFRPFLSSRC